MPFGTNHSTPVHGRGLTLPLAFTSYINAKSRDLLSQILEKGPRYRITIPRIKAHSMFRGM